MALKQSNEKFWHRSVHRMKVMTFLVSFPTNEDQTNPRNKSMIFNINKEGKKNTKTEPMLWQVSTNS